MSETKAFRFKGTEQEWNQFVGKVKAEGKTIEEVLSPFVLEQVGIQRQQEEKDTSTASLCEDNLVEYISKNYRLDNVIRNGHIHIDLNCEEHRELIETSGFDLSRRVKNAVIRALYKFWTERWTKLRGYEPNQASTKYSTRADGENLRKYLQNIKVTFSCDVIPKLALHELREDDLGKIKQFDCIVIGPSPKKLDTLSGKYIQKILIQEPEDQSKDNNPTIMKCVIHGDDTNEIASGKRIRVIGIYKTEETINGQTIKIEKPLHIDAVAVKELDDQQPVTLTPHEIQVAREFATMDETNYISHIIESFCPKIYGRSLEKMAILFALLGGSDFVGYRKEIHVLLVGEADTGKSELIKFANTVAQKCSIVDGSNATGVGVLFALDEYDGIKILRAGAMILNNGGNLIIDEYDKMPKTEQKKLNNAMEQQRAIYNKGGHYGNAETKTGIIAASNPANERWNPDKSIIDNLPFDSSSLSRFDVVIRLDHSNDEAEERNKMKHKMRHKRGESAKVAHPEYLKGLINHLKTQNPRLTAKAEELLINKFIEYKFLKQDSDALPIETRQMEGIQRLCEAYAKLTFRKEIDEKVVEYVIGFYKNCLKTLGMNTDDGVHQVDMRGHHINKDEFFDECFRLLSLEDENGDVLEYDLGVKLKENYKFYPTDKSVMSHIEQRKKAGLLYEPTVGKLRRQRK